MEGFLLCFVGDWQTTLTSQTQPQLIFINKVLLQIKFASYVCLYTTVAELSSFDKAHMACKTLSVHYLALYRKRLLTSF
jgi:hypothetical protein